MLHRHIFGRGNPKEEYIQGVKLDGPEPGEIFDMRAKTLNVPGNDSKIKWKKEDVEKVANKLRQELTKAKKTFEKLLPGLSIITEQPI